ncbi:MAG: PfkB family carbohydrate kinase [Chloroflexota bacterium]
MDGAPHQAGTPGYLVIGHVTQDVAPGRTLIPGGTATYAALTAQRLGYAVGVLTSAHPEAPLPEAERGIEVRRIASPHTTRFENRYEGDQRHQFLRAAASPIARAHLPAAWQSAPIVHLGPVAQEVDPDLLDAFPGAVLGLTPQGWLRRWGADGRVEPCPWAKAERALAAATAVVLSPEDVGGDWALLERYAALARTLAVTLGERGAIIYHDGRSERLPAFAVDVVDPTGAGDVFAAALFIGLRELGDPFAAGRLANCVASFVVEGLGATRLPTRAQVDERLRSGRLRA